VEQAASHAALALMLGCIIAISFPQVTLVNYSTVVNNSLANHSIAVNSSFVNHSIAVSTGSISYLIFINSFTIKYSISIMGSSTIFTSSNAVPAGYPSVSRWLEFQDSG